MVRCKLVYRHNLEHVNFFPVFERVVAFQKPNKESHKCKLFSGELAKINQWFTCVDTVKYVRLIDVDVCHILGHKKKTNNIGDIV